MTSTHSPPLMDISTFSMIPSSSEAVPLIVTVSFTSEPSVGLVMVTVGSLLGWSGGMYLLMIRVIETFVAPSSVIILNLQEDGVGADRKV